MNKTWPSYPDAAKSPSSSPSSPFFTSKHDNLFTIQYISNLFIREAMITYYYGSPADKKKKKSERGWWSNEELCLIIVVRLEEGLRDLSSFQKCCKTCFPLQFQNQLVLTHNHMCIVILPVVLSIHSWFSSIAFNAGLSEPEGGKGSNRPPQIFAYQLTLFQPGDRLYPSHYYFHPHPLDFQNFLRPWICGMRVRADNGRS